MESLKQFMGFLLVATVIWLLWVLGLQAGSNVVIFIMLILLLVSVGGWIYGRWGHLAMPPKTRVIATIIAAVFILAPTVYGLINWKTFAADVNLGGVTKAEGMAWENFDEEKIQAAQAAGRAVFVDFTAAWCLSCQVNEKVAFGNAEVQQAFHDKNILPLKADWTSRDEKITQALAAFGRNSVPLYVYYPAKTGSEPVILPEIISPGIVLEALK
jgi:thiol:disulfide interchange protein DsbD